MLPIKYEGGRNMRFEVFGGSHGTRKSANVGYLRSRGDSSGFQTRRKCSRHLRWHIFPETSPSRL